MTTIDLSMLSAFLSGSAITLLIREVINQINRKVDFDRDLEKMTYQRKLQKAESAVAYYWTYLDKAILIKSSIQIIRRALQEIDETQLDFDVIAEALEKNSNALNDLAGDKYFDINGIHLYFDLKDDESWSEEDLGKLSSCIAEIKYRENEVQYWLSLHENSINNKDHRLEDHYWSEMKKVLPAYVVTLENYITLLEKNKLATHLVINKIKKQLRR